jgi:hypothetical protein
MDVKPARGLLLWWLRRTRWAGLALPPLGAWVEDLNNERLVRHELIHWAQWQRMGTVRYYATYLWQVLRYGYRNAPMEIEAREVTDGVR